MWSEFSNLRMSLSDKSSDQSYFWTPEWQAAEREAEADIAAGRYKTFDTIDELLEDLHSSDD